MTEHAADSDDTVAGTSSGAEIAPGICCECGEHTDHGRVLGHVDQASGAGWTVLICPACDLKPKPRPGRRGVARRPDRPGPDRRSDLPSVAT